MKQEYHKTLKGQLHGTRVSDAQEEIVSDVLQGSATDFSGVSVESDEPPTKKILEYAPNENTAQFSFRNCSILDSVSYVQSNRQLQRIK